MYENFFQKKLLHLFVEQGPIALKNVIVVFYFFFEKNTIL